MLTELLDSCNDRDALNAASKHVNSAVTILQANIEYQKTELPVRKRHILNENHETQFQFHSTKKKKQQATSLTKPTNEECIFAEQTLSSKEVCVCSICFREDDGGKEDTVKWTQCSKFYLWFHCLCVGTESKCSTFSCATYKNNY